MVMQPHHFQGSNRGNLHLSCAGEDFPEPHPPLHTTLSLPLPQGLREELYCMLTAVSPEEAHMGPHSRTSSFASLSRSSSTTMLLKATPTTLLPASLPCSLSPSPSLAGALFHLSFFRPPHLLPVSPCHRPAILSSPP